MDPFLDPNPNAKNRTLIFQDFQIFKILSQKMPKSGYILFLIIEPFILNQPTRHLAIFFPPGGVLKLEVLRNYGPSFRA